MNIHLLEPPLQTLVHGGGDPPHRAPTCRPSCMSGVGAEDPTVQSPSNPVMRNLVHLKLGFVELSLDLLQLLWQEDRAWQLEQSSMGKVLAEYLRSIQEPSACRVVRLAGGRGGGPSPGSDCGHKENLLWTHLGSSLSEDHVLARLGLDGLLLSSSERVGGINEPGRGRETWARLARSCAWQRAGTEPGCSSVSMPTEVAGTGTNPGTCHAGPAGEPAATGCPLPATACSLPGPGREGAAPAG